MYAQVSVILSQPWQYRALHYLQSHGKRSFTGKSETVFTNIR